MTISELCERHGRMALDTNVLIYLFEGAGLEADVCAALVSALEEGAAQGMLAATALTELVVGPVRAGDEALAERYVDAVRSVGGLRIVPVGTEVAIEAGVLRGRHRLTFADALHLAAAREARATAFVTNDRRIPEIPRIEIVRLSEIEA
jgi:predicted nucleic acid-binding protein